MFLLSQCNKKAIKMSTVALFFAYCRYHFAQEINVYILVGWHKNVFISFVENWILGIRREGSLLDLYEVYFCMSVGWWRQKSSMFYILNTLRSVEVDVLFSSYAVILLLKLHFHLKPTNYSNYILLGPKESRTKGWKKKELLALSSSSAHMHLEKFVR